MLPRGTRHPGWGSVLITPDRLQVTLVGQLRSLGFSSHYP